MTFRFRVIAATVGAAAIAVILACFASYFTTRNALFHSVDAVADPGLRVSPRLAHFDDRVTGAYSEIVLPSGETLPASDVPIDDTIMSVAKGKSSRVIRTVVFGGQDYRELIVPLAAGLLRGVPDRTLPDHDDLGGALRRRHRRAR